MTIEITDEKKSSLNYYKPIIQSQREAGQEIEKCCIILNKEIQNEDGKYMEKMYINNFLNKTIQTSYYMYIIFQTKPPK